MNDSIGRSREDYLEAIAFTMAQKGDCHSIDIAHALNISKPSVSVMVKNLESEGYITRQGTSLRLTDKGQAVAETVGEKHRLFKSFFETLGVPEAIAEQDACRVEHDISPETYERVSAWYTALEEEDAAPQTGVEDTQSDN